MTHLVKRSKITKHEIFVAEACKSAVIDTACTKTVTGEHWFHNYLDSLSPQHLQEVEILTSNTPFKFGDGRMVKANKRAIIPATIGDRNCKIETEIVSENIPLLLSQTSMKKAGAVIDMVADKATIFDKEIDLCSSTSGHYCIDIKPNDIKDDNLSVAQQVLLLQNTDKTLHSKQVVKLHKQFGHASAENLKKLIRQAGLMDSELNKTIDDVVNSCETCTVYKKQAARPVVGLSKSDDFNQTVAMDLHQLEPNLWYIHVIDEFTRYSNANLIRNKDASFKAFLKCWISLFGAPAKAFSDNGGEFISDDFVTMCERFNIKISTTPSYSPWSNGLCERHNQTLTNTILKVKEDTKCDWETALAWAISAKNALVNNNGFSPAQLVFGGNPNIPTTLTSHLPALEPQSTSTTIGLHLAALHSARKAFVASESCEKIKRALSKQTRQSRTFYQIGDSVYFKRDDDKCWKGPAKVLGQDGPVVFIRHGSRYIKAHVCRVQPVHQSIPENVNSKEPSKSDPNHAEMSQDKLSIAESDSDDEIFTNNDNSAVVPPPTCEATPSTTEKPTIKVNQRISFRHDNGENYTAKVLSRAGKSSGKYSNWYNIEYESPDAIIGKKDNIDITKAQNLIVVPDDEQPEPQPNIPTDEILEISKVSFEDAKAAELKNWKDHNVYETVPYNQQKCISVRWVCTMKSTNEGMKPKARLVARGFEEQSDAIQKESPTCAKDTLRMVISIIIQNKWKLHSIDIKTAFLQGEIIDRNVFLTPPKEAKCEKGYIWKLRKCVYGLSDASLKWYQRVQNVMISLGGKISTVDPALFIWHNEESQPIGMIAIHVDDFLWSGNSTFQTNVIMKIREFFSIGREEDKSFRYLGLNIEQNEDYITLDQSDYIDALKPILLDHSTSTDRELTTKEKDLLRSKLGQILWISNQTRPDISFDVSSLATNLSEATVKDIVTTNKVIKKIKSQPYQFKIQFKTLSTPVRFVVYTDAAFGNLPDGGSQGGYLIFLVDQNNQCNLISWQSKRLKRIVRSSLAAETLAMVDSIETTLYLSVIYGDFHPQNEKLAIEVVTDNKSLKDALESTKYVSDKRLRIDIGALKQLLKNKDVNKVTWVNTEQQLADVLTKKGVSPTKLMNTLKRGELARI